MIKNLLAAAISDPIGVISPMIKGPAGAAGVTKFGELTGIVVLINTALKILFIVAGVYALFNIVIAGIEFINAGGDAKSVTKAWNRIWQSLLGLVIIVSSFLIAAIIGIILFGDPTYILNPKLNPVQ